MMLDQLHIAVALVRSEGARFWIGALLVPVTMLVIAAVTFVASVIIADTIG